MDIFKRIYNYKPQSKNREEGIQIESDQFIGLRYIVKGDSLIFVSAKNGIFAVDLKMGKVLAQEIMAMVEFYE